jgi:hypothetical protein
MKFQMGVISPLLDVDYADKRRLTDSALRSISIRNQLFVDSARAKALCFIFSLEMVIV